MSARYLLLLLVAALVISLSAMATTPNDAMSFDSVNIIRVAPETMHIGEKTLISVIFENTGSSQKTIGFQEWLSETVDFDKTAATKVVVPHEGEGWYCTNDQCNGSPSSISAYTTTSYSYDWQIRLQPKERTVVTYWIIPRRAGDYSILPAPVTIDGKEYWFHGKIIQIACRNDKVCDTLSGENHNNCPDDCPAWGKDALCNPAKDVHCDPDCKSGADPDCSKPGMAMEPALAIAGAVLTLVVYARKKGRN